MSNSRDKSKQPNMVNSSSNFNHKYCKSVTFCVTYRLLLACNDSRLHSDSLILVIQLFRFQVIAVSVKYQKLGKQPKIKSFWTNPPQNQWVKEAEFFLTQMNFEHSLIQYGPQLVSCHVLYDSFLAYFLYFHAFFNILKNCNWKFFSFTLAKSIVALSRATWHTVSVWYSSCTVVLRKGWWTPHKGQAAPSPPWKISTVPVASKKPIKSSRTHITLGMHC